MHKISIVNRFFILLMFFHISFTAFPQNMNDPYSVYGIGDIDNTIYNRTSGMAGTGLAIPSSAYLIDNNPAGLAGLPRSFFIAHLAITANTSAFRGNPVDASNSSAKDLWIKRFALAVKINKFWASGIGFGQFSNVNYKFTGNEYVEGTTTSYQAFFQGDGGLNDYYWTNAFAIGKHLMIGIKSSVIAGSINQTEILSDAVLQTNVVDSLQDYMGNLRFQGGFIFGKSLNKNWDFSIGGRYTPKTRFASERTLSVRDNNVSIVEEKYLTPNRFYLPETFAAGIALKHNKKTTFAADYTHEDWSSLILNGNGWNLTNSDRVSAGVEFSKIKNEYGLFSERRFFQLGGYYGTSYLQVNNTPIREYGFTAGMGGVLSNNLLYAISFYGAVKGTTSAGLIKQTSFGLTLNISYRDFLLSKGRKYD